MKKNFLIFIHINPGNNLDRRDIFEIYIRKKISIPAIKVIHVRFLMILRILKKKLTKFFEHASRIVVYIPEMGVSIVERFPITFSTTETRNFTMHLLRYSDV